MGHLDDTRRAYDRAARKYDACFHNELEQKPDDLRWLDAFAEALGPGALVCDAGCGPCGHVTHYLHERGLNVFGIDISPACIEIARGYHPEIPFMVMDMARLELPDSSLHGLVAFYSIIHTPKRLIPGVFREFRRVLKTGGRLLVVVKEGDGEGYVDRLMDEPAHVWFAHFQAAEIRAYFEAARFSLNRLETRPPYEFEIDVPRIYAEGHKK